MENLEDKNTITFYFFNKRFVIDKQSIFNLMVEELSLIELNTFADEQIDTIISNVITAWNDEIEINELEPYDISYNYWNCRMNIFQLYSEVEQIIIDNRENSKNKLFVGVSKLMPALCEFLYSTILKKMYEYVTKSPLEIPPEFNN